MSEASRRVTIRTVSSTLALALRERILAGEIAPGSRLQQNDVAREFNVSSTPVREAFAELAHEGLVKAIAHRGVEVFRPTLADAIDAAEIQELLEGPCIAASAPLLRDEDLAKAASLLDQHRALTSQDRRRGLDLDTDFHLTLLARCPNVRLRNLAGNARRDTLAHRLVLVAVDEPTGEYVRTIRAQHDAIYAACAARDGAEAARHTVEHIRWSRQVFADPS